MLRAVGALQAWSIVDARAVVAYITAQTYSFKAGEIEWTPLVQSDPEAVLGLLERAAHDSLDAQVALHFWARKDPLAAIAYAGSVADPGLRGNYLGEGQ